MTLPIFRKMAWFWAVFFISPIILVYFTGLTSPMVWCWAWLLVWVIFIHMKADELTRGLFFIIASVIVAIIGKPLIGAPEHQDILSALQNVMLLVSGGVGGNFMAAALLRK